MQQARIFLVVADDPERLMRISATLHHKFPNAVVQTCRDSSAALTAAKTHKVDAVIAHRSTDMDEIPLLEEMRAATTAPILAVSNLDQKDAARMAGASYFLGLEQWLLIGRVVADMIGARPV